MTIDAVITWVNGHDPLHQAKLSHYLATHRPNLASAAPTRFNECGEIHYCVHSLLRFAPWIRYIFIVTDNQIPPIFQQLQATAYAQKLHIIDHRTLFSGYEDALPTFNSLSIESLLHGIPGLSSHFIYLNDDCFVIRPITAEDFFQNNKMVIRGEWKTHSKYQWFKKIRRKTLCLHRQVQENSAWLTGFTKKFFHLPHAPMPLDQKILNTFFDRYPEQLKKNIDHPLRDPTQFWSISLAHHLAIAQQDAIIDNRLQSIMINGATHSLKKITQRLTTAEKNNAIAFVCAQSLDCADAITQKSLFTWLDKHIME